MTRLYAAAICMGLVFFLVPALSQEKKAGDKERSKEFKDAEKRIAELTRMLNDEVQSARFTAQAHEEQVKRLQKQIDVLEWAKDGKAPNLTQKNSLLLRLLQQPIETRGLQERVKLKTALEYVADKFGGLLPILADKEAFLAILGPDAADPYENEVVLPPVPAKMPMNTALRLILSQVGDGNATFIVRQGFIEITTLENATAARRLQEALSASFDKRPLRDALDELASYNGATINLDPNVGQKADTPITAELRNTPLEDALVTVTESAGLKFVPLYNSIYVTTPAKAKRIEQEERERAKKRLPANRRLLVPAA